MTTPKTPARLDADRTAEPLTRIVHHPPRGARLGPHMALVDPEYEDERGNRTPLAKPHDLTSSDVALAKVLAAWEEWPGEIDGESSNVLARVSLALGVRGHVADGDLAPKARALLDRARKAGVL